MLDEDQEITKELTQPYGLEDLPVLKSFVEDVPTLNESMIDSEEQPRAIAPSTAEDDPLAISPEVRKQHSEKTAQPPTIQRADSSVSTNSPREINPDDTFLSKSTLSKLKSNASQKPEAQISQELRNLVKQRSLPNFSPNSKEYQALRTDASKMVNEVIKLFIPRMEAELRMRLEKEVDEYLNELRKNAED